MIRSAAIFFDVFLIQLASYRWAWPWQLIAGIVAPLGMMFLLKSLLLSSPPLNSPSLNSPVGGEDLALGAHILAGNIVSSTLMSTMGSTAMRFAHLKATEGLDYYAVLPVSRTTLVGAVVLAFITLSVPGLMATVLLGRFLFGLPLEPHPLALAVILLASLSMATVGTAIGILTPNPETAGMFENLAMFAMLFLSPVMIPAERLPGPLQFTSRLFPTSYAIEALKRLLVGALDQTVLLDVAILAVFCAVALYLASKRLDWRRR
ncbi:MAG: ABC transporter permease [Chloroflexi bacterium]|nr:ABC transporter permease [Chloroflexota bacterium]